MKHLLSAALVLTLGSGMAIAQQAAPAPQDAQQPQGQQAWHQHAHNPQREAQHLAKRLSLTPDQTAKLEPILASREQQMQAIRSNGQLTQQDARMQMRALHKSTQDQLAGILTPDQMEQMKQMRHGPHGPHGQWQGGPQGQGRPQPSGV